MLLNDGVWPWSVVSTVPVEVMPAAIVKAKSSWLLLPMKYLQTVVLLIHLTKLQSLTAALSLFFNEVKFLNRWTPVCLMCIFCNEPRLYEHFTVKLVVLYNWNIYADQEWMCVGKRGHKRLEYLHSPCYTSVAHWSKEKFWCSPFQVLSNQ